MGIERTNLKQAIDDGRAIAALSADMRSAADQGVKGSPTWVLNEGRQVLYGNIGYRILSANIEELLKHPGNEASWC
jgi:predicted DsbA family dithiol-disulfide isomerase